MSSDPRLYDLVRSCLERSANIEFLPKFEFFGISDSILPNLSANLVSMVFGPENVPNVRRFEFEVKKLFPDINHMDHINQLDGFDKQIVVSNGTSGVEQLLNAAAQVESTVHAASPSDCDCRSCSATEQLHPAKVQTQIIASSEELVAQSNEEYSNSLLGLHFPIYMSFVKKFQEYFAKNYPQLNELPAAGFPKSKTEKSTLKRYRLLTNSIFKFFREELGYDKLAPCTLRHFLGILGQNDKRFKDIKELLLTSVQGKYSEIRRKNRSDYKKGLSSTDSPLLKASPGKSVQTVLTFRQWIETGRKGAISYHSNDRVKHYLGKFKTVSVPKVFESLLNHHLEHEMVGKSLTGGLTDNLADNHLSILKDRLVQIGDRLVANDLLADVNWPLNYTVDQQVLVVLKQLESLTNSKVILPINLLNTADYGLLASGNEQYEIRFDSQLLFNSSLELPKALLYYFFAFSFYDKTFDTSSQSILAIIQTIVFQWEYRDNKVLSEMEHILPHIRL